jgi:hypothetical protein
MALGVPPKSTASAAAPQASSIPLRARFPATTKRVNASRGERMPMR